MKGVRDSAMHQTEAWAPERMMPEICSTGRTMGISEDTRGPITGNRDGLDQKAALIKHLWSGSLSLAPPSGDTGTGRDLQLTQSTDNMRECGHPGRG